MTRASRASIRYQIAALQYDLSSNAPRPRGELAGVRALERYPLTDDLISSGEVVHRKRKTT